MNRSSALVLGGLLACAALAWHGPRAAAADEPVGTAQAVSGSVWIAASEADLAKHATALAKNGPVRQGDWIETDKQGRACIVFGKDVTRVTLMAGTKFCVATYVSKVLQGKDEPEGFSLFKLITGKLKAVTGSLFGSEFRAAVQTKNSTCGIRGSTVVVTVDAPGSPHGTNIYNFESHPGTVRYTDEVDPARLFDLFRRWDSWTVLDPGQFVWAPRPGAATKPRPIPPAVQQSLTEESTVPDAPPDQRGQAPGRNPGVRRVERVTVDGFPVRYVPGRYELALYDDDLRGGKLRIEGRLVPAISSSVARVSLDDGKTWSDLSPDASGRFDALVPPPSPGEGRAVFKVGEAEALAFPIVFRRGTRGEQIRKHLTTMGQSYEREDPTSFMDVVAMDFRKEATILRAALAKDFVTFDQIRLDVVLKNEYSAPNGELSLDLSWHVELVLSANGRRLRPADGRSTFVFARDRGDRLIDMRGDLLFGRTSRELLLQTGVREVFQGNNIVQASTLTGRYAMFDFDGGRVSNLVYPATPPPAAPNDVLFFHGPPYGLVLFTDGSRRLQVLPESSLDGVKDVPPYPGGYSEHVVVDVGSVVAVVTSDRRGVGLLRIESVSPGSSSFSQAPPGPPSLNGILQAMRDGASGQRGLFGGGRALANNVPSIVQQQSAALTQLPAETTQIRFSWQLRPDGLASGQ